MVGKDKISCEGIEKEIYSLSEQALSQIPLDRETSVGCDSRYDASCNVAALFQNSLSDSGDVSERARLSRRHRHSSAGGDRKNSRHVGITPEEYKTKYSKIQFYNHSYNHPAQLNTIGSLTGSEMSELSNGLFTDRWVSQSISAFSSSINCF